MGQLSEPKILESKHTLLMDPVGIRNPVSRSREVESLQRAPLVGGVRKKDRRLEEWTMPSIMSLGVLW